MKASSNSFPETVENPGLPMVVLADIPSMNIVALMAIPVVAAPIVKVTVTTAGEPRAPVAVNVTCPV